MEGDRTMDCERVAARIDAYIDGELDLSSTLMLEAHLAACPRCRALRDAKAALSTALQAGLERHAASAELRDRLTLMIAPYHSRAAKVPHHGKPAAKGWQRRQIFAMAASVAVAVVASSAGTYWLMRDGDEPQIADQVVASHIRSLMAGHLIDIASSDRQTVKPWFDGKVDVAPAVADLGKEGFPLMGGRLDYIDRRPVAALVYRRHSHLINVFACPVMQGEAHEPGPEALTLRGYNLLYWTAGDVTYWAVSDANLGDLQNLRTLIQRSEGESPA